MLFHSHALILKATLLAALLYTITGNAVSHRSATVPHVDLGFVKDRYDLPVSWALPDQKPARRPEGPPETRDRRRGTQFYAHRDENGSKMIPQSHQKTTEPIGETPIRLLEIDMAEPMLRTITTTTSEPPSGSEHNAESMDEEKGDLTQPVATGIRKRRLQKDTANSGSSPTIVRHPAKARANCWAHSCNDDASWNRSLHPPSHSRDDSSTQIPAFAEPDRFSIPPSSQTADSSTSGNIKTSSIMKRAIGDLADYGAFPSTPSSPSTSTSSAPPPANVDQHWYSNPWVGCASWLFFLYSLASFIMLSWLWAKGWVDCTGQWLRPIPMREREGSMWVNDSGRVERDG